MNLLLIQASKGESPSLISVGNKSLMKTKFHYFLVSDQATASGLSYHVSTLQNLPIFNSLIVKPFKFQGGKHRLSYL